MPAPKGNQYAKGNRGGGGKGTSYNARSVPPLVRELRARGATTREIAEYLKISDRTLRDWRTKYKELSAALKIGTEAMIHRSRESLFDRAVGYTYETELVRIMPNGTAARAPIVEHVQPDATAALKILERLDPETWRERTEIKSEVTFSWAKLVEEVQQIKAQPVIEHEE